MSGDETNSYQDYWNYVRSIAADALSDAEVTTQQEYEDKREQIDEDIYSSVDGSEWIIYTYNAEAVMHHTENEDALFDQTGEIGHRESWSEVVTQFAYCAMLEDVRGELQRAVDSLPEGTDEGEGDLDCEEEKAGEK